jgi:IMP dehydrogenase
MSNNETLHANSDTFLTFDDVLLMPQYSNIKSRDDVSIASSIGRGISEIKLQLPIIAAPMDTVTESAMAFTMAVRGGFGIIHRYMEIDRQAQMVADAVTSIGPIDGAVVGAAIGATGDYYERFTELVAAGAKVICIDVAHGDHLVVKEALEALAGHPDRDKTHIMAGNIATSEAYRRLSDWGADSIRVGVGGGSVCTTRINTGHGAPNIGVILAIAAEREANGGASIVLDGGIKTSGDIVKALAFGADAVMCGGMLSGTTSTPGEKTYKEWGARLVAALPEGWRPAKLNAWLDSKAFKSFRGMASRSAQAAWRNKKPASSEGLATEVKYKGSTHDLISEIQGHIKSGLSYSGARTVEELVDVSRYIVQTTAGQREAHPHIHSK